MQRFILYANFPSTQEAAYRKVTKIVNEKHSNAVSISKVARDSSGRILEDSMTMWFQPYIRGIHELIYKTINETVKPQ